MGGNSPPSSTVGWWLPWLPGVTPGQASAVAEPGDMQHLPWSPVAVAGLMVAKQPRRHGGPNSKPNTKVRGDRLLPMSPVGPHFLKFCLYKQKDKQLCLNPILINHRGLLDNVSMRWY